MENPQIHTMVWDLDNNPCDWVTYAAKTYPAMRDFLVRFTGQSRGRVTECMRNFYQRAGTIESSWLVQDLERERVLALDEQERDWVITTLRRIYHRNRSKYLKLFEGFPEIFELAAKNHATNLIHTDAPITHAASRVRHLKLDQSLFSGMIAMPDSLPEEIPEEFRGKPESENYGLQFPVYIADSEKPHTNIHIPLGVSEEEVHEHFAFSGDNYAKDMGMASRYEALGFHSLWGKASQKNLDIVAEFSGRRIASRNSEQTAAEHSFSTVIEVGHPLDIAGLLGWS